jgi:pimeloyl-ACP methyl ester carboxylesterase
MAMRRVSHEISRLTAGSHAFILPGKHNLGHHTLGYHVAGKTTGEPIFYFHGTPSCRLEADGFDKTASEKNICIIGVDRPGIGLSTFRPGYSLLDWPRDVRALAEYLGFSTFRVLGGSGGGPYALACARVLPEDVLKATGVLAGVGPPSSGSKGLSWEKWLGFHINSRLPRWMLHFIIEHGLARHARNPDQTRWRKIVIDGMIKRLPSRDQNLFDERETERMIREIRECTMSGSDGYVLDAQSILRPWPFEVKSIRAKVQIWNGTDDTDTPIHMARWMANELPRGVLREFEGDSHISTFAQRQQEVFEDLLNM